MVAMPSNTAGTTQAISIAARRRSADCWFIAIACPHPPQFVKAEPPVRRWADRHQSKVLGGDFVSRVAIW